MLKRFLPATLFAAAAFLAVADNVARLTLVFTDGTTATHDLVLEDQVTIDHEGNQILLPDGLSYSLSDIASLTFESPSAAGGDGEMEPSDEITTVYVDWDGTDAPRIRCSAPGIAAVVDGQHVTLNNTDASAEMTYVLSGAATDASFTLAANYKSTIRLNGLQLASSKGAALNILCGKRVALELVEGTVSTLADAPEDLGQKAALYCKGHLEISGAGTLQLTGNAKHALSTKEYLQLKGSTGRVEVLKAAADGLHAGQYFRMDGGDVSIASVGGDGIQAEITDDTSDELNGQLVINDGTIDVRISGTDVAALKSDSLLTISGGTLTLTTDGEGAKGLKSKTDISILGGNLSISQQGDPYILGEETTYVAAIKGNAVSIGGGNITIGNSAVAGRGISADSIAQIAAGTVGISMTGNGGRGIKSDGDITVGNEADGSGPALSVTTTGGVYTATANSQNSPAKGPGGGWPPGGGGGWPPGGGGGSNGSAAKAIKADNTFWQYGGNIYVKTTGTEAEGIETKANSETAMNFCGGQTFIEAYDDGINAAGKINFRGANVICLSTGNDAIDSNYGRTGAVTVTAGTVIAFSQRGDPEMGIDCDNMAYVVVNGGILVAGGGCQGGSSASSLSSATVPSKCWSSRLSYSQGAYYSIGSAGGNILTWYMPLAVNSSYNVFATGAVSKDTSCTLYENSAAPAADGIGFAQPGGDKPMLWVGNGSTTGTQKATIAL